jgi:hypothetical protein
MTISPDLEHRLEQERLERYHTIVSGAGNRQPPAETPKVDHEKVAQALRDAWLPSTKSEVTK